MQNRNSEVYKTENSEVYKTETLKYTKQKL